MKIINYIICFFKGHQSKEMIIEDKYTIYTRGCERCGCSLGMPKYWKSVINFPPPGTNTEEKLKDWKTYCEEKMQSIRDSVK